MGDIKQKTSVGIITGAVVMAFIGIMMVLKDPATARLVRATPFSALPVFILFVFAWAAVGAFIGGLIAQFRQNRKCKSGL